MELRTESVERDLRSLLRGDVEFDPISRRLYATDAGLSQIEPMGAVSPRDADDVVRLVAYAAERGLSLVPRGMASGLNGGAVGAGIQVDFTRYMNSILEVAPDRSWVRVQPGVVLASLNRHLKSYGVFFAPDPSSENHCSLGGMIGTNASGSRTVAYGATKDHVLALDVVMADGSRYDARPMRLGEPALAAFLTGDALAAKAFAIVLPELQSAEETIRSRMPRVVKNSCGYRVEAVMDEGSSPGVAHLQRLFVGAEGTLGLVTEATLNLVPLPAKRGIAMAYFPSVFACGEAVPGILALSPSAAEIMDSRFLAFIRKHDSRVDAMLPERTNTALLIEFEARNDGELDEKFADLRRHLDATEALQLVRANTAAATDHLWAVRRSAVSLMQRMPGPRRALPFVEDVTVHPTEVPGYVDFLQRLFDRENVEAVMVGHVGDGNIHTRPLLDPKDPGDLRVMQRLYEEIFAYVLTVRGTMAGEHGDGLVGTPHLEQMYGEEIYALFTRIKKAFDPQGILNPGKKVSLQEKGSSLFRDTRYGAEYRTLPQRPVLHFPHGGYEYEIEKCHGCAQCKSPAVTTMCPTYKASRREHASPRAKANLLRAIITGALDPESAYGHAATKSVTDYCIVCGMCAVECPSRVNIPKLMLEAKSKYRQQHPGSPAESILAHAEMVSRLGLRTAPLANRMVNLPTARRLAGRLLGIDPHRKMAPFARRTFSGLINERSDARSVLEPAATGPTVAYFYDLFANYNDPGLALSVERVLKAHGLRVVIPEQRPSGIPEMLYGYVKDARAIAADNVRRVLPLVLAGAVLVSSEPTATFAFKVHYPDYLNDPNCSLVANATRDLGEFLVRYRSDHRKTVPAVGPIRRATAAALRCRRDGARHTSVALDTEPSSSLRVAYHQPCHLKAQEIGNPALELLREIPGLEVIELAAGCCGMAGTYGMKTGTYDFSMQVGKPLFDRVAEVSPDVIASECATCRMQIAQATGIRTVHPIMLLADSYGQ